MPIESLNMTSYMMTIVMFALISLTIYEIFANEIKYQKFDLENEGHQRVKQARLCAIRLETFDSFRDFLRILGKWQQTFTQKW